MYATVKHSLLISVAIAMLADGCSDYRLQREPALFFEPPLLQDTAGLDGLVELDEQALAFGSVGEASFSNSRPFYGFIFAAAAGDSADVRLVAEDSLAAPAMAIYGPRRADGLFGTPRLASEPRAGAVAELLGVPLSTEGDYLVLVTEVAGRGGIFHLRLECSSSCGIASCPALVCGIYCPAGLVRGADGCPSSCACRQACTVNSDCPYGFACFQGSCSVVSSCACQDPYQPVCGKDGTTYANLCELGCAEVELEHMGPCSSAACVSDADCSPGQVCREGRCVVACECQGFDPVCGTDGRTYFSDCERRCAGVGLDHLGPCEICNSEVCDGLDNDCDGLIDEGACAGSCAVDSDCSAGQLCQAGICAAALACSTAVDCPAGQVCEQYLCRLVGGCGPEQCNGRDDDCDGQIDEGCPVECQANVDCPTGWECRAGRCVEADCTDADGDGYQTCAGDCDDTDASINPGAPEMCNGRDDDCDGQVDDGCQTCSTDADCQAGESCCAGLCVDTRSSNSHCGGCGIACSAGRVCQEGVCAPVACQTNSDCPAGQVCNFGVCIVPCSSDADCDDANPATNDWCINSTCLNRFICSTDVDCKVDEICYGSECVLPCRSDGDCPKGETCQGGICSP